MEQKDQKDRQDRQDISKRSVELLNIFIKEFDQPHNRTVLLD